MPNKHQQRHLLAGKKKALLAILDALDHERLPTESLGRGGSPLPGSLEEYFEEYLLPLPRGSLLAVLREADVPHDSHNRFLPYELYDHHQEFLDLYLKYNGTQHRKQLPLPRCQRKAPWWKSRKRTPNRSGSSSSTTVALLTSVVKAVVGSDIAGLGPDGIVSTETRTI